MTRAGYDFNIYAVGGFRRRGVALLLPAGQPDGLDHERRESGERREAASAIVHARWQSEACSDTRPRR